jgi:hypothetical protein
VNHIVEIWEMVREDRTVCVPTCLVCGWMGADGPRPHAEREGLAHEEGGTPSVAYRDSSILGSRTDLRPASSEHKISPRST